MPSLPRFAIGTIQDGADSSAVLAALLETLRRGGVQTQCFGSQSSLPGPWLAKAVTGLPARYLDSWLMSPEVCRDLFFRAAGAADLAAVTGRFDSVGGPGGVGASLDALSTWLGLPRLAVVNDSLVDGHGLPQRPRADAIFLDHTSPQRDLPAVITDLEALWGLPVVGALDRADGVRRQLAAIHPGTTVPPGLWEQLMGGFIEHWRPERFLRLVEKSEFFEAPSEHAIHDLSPCRPTVALAYDEAFFGYFPSTLDHLEMLGAQVVDFSPLRDEGLPPGTDIVYLGCGRPEAFARELSENHCMKSALRSHVARGGRVYGEVGGAAYLCQMLETPSGEMLRMCGILPAIARFHSADGEPDRAELTVGPENWLAQAGTVLRGYRSHRWRFEALGCHLDPGRKCCCQPDLIGCNHVVGSVLHLQFSVFPELLQRFFRLPTRSTPILDPWQIAS